METNKHPFDTNKPDTGYSSGVTPAKGANIVSHDNLDKYKDYVDFNVFNPIDNDINEIRANNQGFGEKLGRTSVNFLATAGVTAADGIIGTIAGIGNYITGGEDKVHEFNDFINNPFSVSVNDWLDGVKQENELYKTKEEQNNPFYKNMDTANFWLGQFENAGFMVGALAAGWITGGVASELLGVNKLAKSSELINALKKIDAVGDLPTKQLTKQTLALMETSDVSQDIINIAKKLKTNTAASQIIASSLGAFGEARIEALSNGKQFREAQLGKLKEQFGENIPQAELDVLENNAKSMENNIFALNSVVLGMSNYSQFRNLFANSTKLSKAITSDIVKNEGKYAVRNVSGLENFGRSAAAIVKNPLSEMTEEQLQYAISQGTADYYDLYSDPKANKSVGDSIKKGLSDAYGTSEGWENAFGGFLMGGLGILAPSKVRKEDGKQGYKFEFGGLKEYKEEKEATKALVGKANQYATDSAFSKLYVANVVNEKLEKNKQIAKENNDEVTERTLDLKQLANMVSTYSDLGKLDELKGRLGEVKELVDSKDAEGLRNLLAYKTVEKDAEGNDKEVSKDSFADLNDEKLFQALSKTIDKNDKKIDDLNTLYNSINTRFSNFSEDSRKSLFLNLVEQKDLQKRGNELYKEIYSKTMINSGANIASKDTIKRKVDEKITDEELLKDKENWTNSIDINGFTQAITRKEGFESFVNSIEDYKKNNPSDLDIQNQAEDLLKIAATRKVVNEQYHKMVTGQDAIEEERIKTKAESDQEIEDNKLQSKQANDFHKEHTINDENGFESSEIILHNPNGGSDIVFKLDKNDKTILRSTTSKNPDGSPLIFKLQDFLNTVHQNGGKYIEDLGEGNTISFDVKIKHANDVRVDNQNKAELAKTQAGIDALDSIAKNIQKEIDTKENTLVFKHEKIQKELDVIAQQLTRAYKLTERQQQKLNLNKLLEKREELINEIIEIEEQLVNDKTNYEHLTIYLEQLRTKKETVLKHKEILQKELDNAKKDKSQKYESKYATNLENKKVEVEKEIKDLEEGKNFLANNIQLKEKYLENLYKVIDAINLFLENSLYNMVGDNKIINQILEEKGITDTASLLDWFRNYNGDFIGNKKINQKEFSEVLAEVLSMIKDSDLDKYQAEAKLLEVELNGLKEEFKNKTEENKEILKKKQSILSTINTILKVYNDKLAKPTKYNNEKSDTEETPLINYPNIKEIPEYNQGKDVSVYQFFISAGRDMSNTGEYSVDEKQFNPNEHENNFYRWLENESIKFGTNDLQLMVIKPNDKEYGIGTEKSIYEKEAINVSGKQVTLTDDDIRFIVVNKKTGNPITYIKTPNNTTGIVSGRFRTNNTKFTDGNDRYYSSKTETGSIEFQKEIDEATKANDEFKKQINESSERVLLNVRELNRGRVVNNNKPTSIVGSLIDTKANLENELKNITIEVSAPINGESNLQRGLRNVQYPAGSIIIGHKLNENNDGNKYTAVTRKVNANEANTLLALLKHYCSTYNKTVGTTAEKEAAANNIDFGNKPQNDNSWRTIQYIKNMIYLGENSIKKVQIINGKLVLDGQLYTMDELMSGEKDSEIKEFLQQKTYQVNNNKHLNSSVKNKYKYVEYKNGKFIYKDAINYKTFLLASENPILQVMVKPMLPVTEQDTITKPELRRFISGSIAFYPTTNPEGKAKFKSLKPDVNKGVSTPTPVNSNVLVFRKGDKTITLDLNEFKLSSNDEGYNKLLSGKTFNPALEEVFKVIKTLNNEDAIIAINQTKDQYTSSLLANGFELEQPTEVKDEKKAEFKEEVKSKLEDKKADIERRRQEELFTKKRNDNKFGMVEGLIQHMPKVVLDVIDFAKAGLTAQSITDEVNKLHDFKSPFTRDDVKDIRKYLGISRNGTSSGFMGSNQPTAQEKKEAKELFNKWVDLIKSINAKYDAELAALETTVKAEPIDALNQKMIDLAEGRVTNNIHDTLVTNSVEEEENDLSEPEDNPLGKNKLFEDNGTIINIDEAKQNLANLLGITPEIITGELIDGIAGGRILNDGKILLSDLATKGTEFHEAFHRVSNFLISSSRRNEIYSEYRKNNNFTGTDEELEEILADKFMDYMLNPEIKLNKEVKGWFKKLINFIKTVFNLHNELSKNKKLYKLFSEIKKGEFKNSPMLYQTMDYNLLNSLQHKRALQIHAYFAHYVTEDLEALNQIAVKGASDLTPIYNKIFENILKKVTTQKEKDLYITAHSQYLKMLGIKAEVADLVNEVEEDLEDTRIDIIEGEHDSKVDNNYKEGYTTRSTDNMFKSIKFIISGVYEKVDKVTMATDFNKLVNNLGNLLADSLDYKDMMLKLSTSTDNKILQVYQKLNQLNENSTWLETDLHQSFFEVFYKNKNIFFKTLLNNTFEDSPNGDGKKVKIGKLTTVSGNTSKKENNLKQDFINAIQNESYVERVNGTLKIPQKILDLKIVDVESAVQVLDAIGIEYFNDKVEELEQNPEYRNEIKEFVLALKANNNLMTSFDGTTDSGRLNKLLSIAASFTTEEIESKASTATGVTVHALQNNSFFTKTLNSLKRGVIPSHLQNDAYASDSLILDLVKNNNISIETGVLTGITEDDMDGEDTSKLTEIDFLKQEVVSVIDGNFPLLPTSSLKTARTITLKDKRTNRSILFIDPFQETANSIKAKLVEQLYNYYINDVTLKPVYEKNTNPDYIINGVDKLGSVTLFDKIVSSQHTAETDIAKYVDKLIEDNIKFFEENNVITENYNPFNLNILKNTFGTETPSVQELVSAYTANFVISNIEQTKIVFGHPALYKFNKKGKIDVIDLFKRTKAAVSESTPLLVSEESLAWMNKNMPRLDGKQRDGSFSLLTFEDVKAELDSEEGELTAEVKKIFKEKYREVEEADAYGLCFDDFYRDLQFMSHRWTEENNNDWLLDQEDLETSDDYITAPIKPVINGSQSEDNFRPIYGKTALLRISKSLLESLKIDNKYPQLKKLIDNIQELNKKDIHLDVALFKSATKIGYIKKKSTGELQPFYNKEGVLADIDENYIANMSLDNIGIQVENKVDNTKTVTTGTQNPAILMSNLCDAGTFIDEEVEVGTEKLKVEDAVKQYFDVQNELTTELRQRLENELELETVNGKKVFANNGEALKEFLLKEVNKQSLNSQNNVEGLVEELKKLDNEQNVSLETLVNYKKIENLLSSIVEKRVVAQKRFGKAMVQFPSSGLELEARKYNAEKDTFISKGLKFYTNKEGKRVMQVYLPYYFKGVAVNIDKYDARLKQMYAFRIPTEQLNSIDALEVVGFLPKSYGNTVIVPSGITMKVGSDFDFDKLNIYYPNFKSKEEDEIKSIKKFLKSKGYRVEDTNNTISKSVSNFQSLLETYNFENNGEVINIGGHNIPIIKEYEGFRSSQPLQQIYIDYNETNLNNPKYKVQALQNRLLELSLGLLTPNFRLNQHLAPNTIKDIKENIVETIRKKKADLGIETNDFTDYDISDIFSIRRIADIKTKFWYGRDLIGIIALYNKNHFFKQISNLQLNNVKGEEKIRINFEGIDNTEPFSLGKMKDLKGNLITSSFGQGVSLVVDIEKNPDILPVLNLNNETVNAAMLLLDLGIPRETVFFFLSQPSVVRFVEHKQRGLSNAKAKEAIETKYGVVGSTFMLNDTMLLKYEDEYQAQIFQDFLKYNELGNDMSNFQSALSFDTKGFRNNVELNQNIGAYNKAVNNPLFINTDAYINTYLKGFIDNVIGSENYWQSLFMTQRLPKDNREKVLEFYNELLDKFGSKEKKVQVAQIFNEDLISYILQNTENGIYDIKNSSKMNDRYDYLFKGQNSLPKRFAKFLEENPNLDKLKILTPIVNIEGKDNLKLFNKKLTPYETDILVEAFKDLINKDSKLAIDLFDFQIMQSGFNTTTLSYLSVLPNTNVNEQTGKNMFNFNIYTSYLLNQHNNAPIDFDEFKELFYLNNYNNKLLIPYLWEENMRGGHLFVKDSYANNFMVKTGSSKKEGVKIWKNISYKDAEGVIQNKNLFDLVQVRGNNKEGKDYRPLDKKSVPQIKEQPIQNKGGIDGNNKINIYAGTNENAELSNFAIRPFKVVGETYKTVEAAFQAAKSNYAPSTQENLNIVKKLQGGVSGAEAKSLGKQIKGLETNKWDKNSSVVMKELLLESFKQNPKALKKLLDTSNVELTHTQDKSKWGKEFPKLLMEVREELRQQFVEQPINKEIKSNEVNLNPTSISEENREKYKNYVLDKIGKINKVSKIQNGYEVIFENGEKTEIFPKQGQFSNLTKYTKENGADIKIFAGINKLIENQSTEIKPKIDGSVLSDNAKKRIVQELSGKYESFSNTRKLAFQQKTGVKNLTELVEYINNIINIRLSKYPNIVESKMLQEISNKIDDCFK